MCDQVLPVRVYVLHPYNMVADRVTGTESSDPESVLDGDIDQFLLARIRQKAKECL